MTERPTIVFLINAFGVGGSESKVVKLANSFSSTGENVEVAYLNLPDALVASLDTRIKVTCLHRRGRYSLAALHRLGRSIRGKSVVIVAVYLYPVLYAIPAIRIYAGKPSRVVCLINTTDLPEGERSHGYVFAPALRRCDRLIYGCKSQQTMWSGNYRLPIENSTYIYNGIDVGRFTPTFREPTGIALRKELDFPTDSFVIGSVGRLAPEKNFKFLIRVLAILTDQDIDAFLILVGEGPEKDGLIGLAENLGVASRVRFLGLLSDVRPAISAIDVFVLPSVSETFSNAALEAMAMAKPVVLSDIGGASEMVDDGVSGLLFKNGDIDQLEHAVRRLADSTRLRESLGMQARKRVVANFKLSDMIDGYRRELIGKDHN